MKFRRKPLTVEAVQFTEEDNRGAVRDFAGDKVQFVMLNEAGQMAVEHGGAVAGMGCLIHTLEGDMLAREGDWIVKGTQGEFHPVRQDIFRDIYEPATHEQSQA